MLGVVGVFAAAEFALGRRVTEAAGTLWIVKTINGVRQRQLSQVCHKIPP